MAFDYEDRSKYIYKEENREHKFDHIGVELIVPLPFLKVSFNSYSRIILRELCKLFLQTSSGLQFQIYGFCLTLI